MAKKSSKKSNVGKAVAVGAGLAALSGAAYAFFGPDGKKNQKKLKRWAEDMRDEVTEKFEDMKDVTEPMYNKVVEEVSKKYAQAKGVSVDEVNEAVEDLKKHWKVLSKDAGKLAKGAKKTVSKSVKSVKKVVKKVTKAPVKKVAKKKSKK